MWSVLSSRVHSYVVSVFIALIILSCNPLLCGASSGPAHDFDISSVPAAPDYSNLSCWAKTPENPGKEPVDVLFFYPTTFFGNNNWNQSIKEAASDAKIPKWIRSQAGVFSDMANIYAPYYRQATIYALDAPAGSNNHRSLDVAYSDIEKAFDYYMKNWNEGRPFILAGHSQGSNHLLLLLERRFSDEALRKKLIAAYVIGWSVTNEDLKKYTHLKMSEAPDETGCIISYNTQTPDASMSIVRKGAVAVNPLTMTLTKDNVPAEKNLGAMFFTDDGNVLYIPHYTGAKAVNGALTIPVPSGPDFLKPSYPGFYHQYDYAFFYCNLVENVRERIKTYLSRNPYVK